MSPLQRAAPLCALGALSGALFTPDAYAWRAPEGRAYIEHVREAQERARRDAMKTFERMQKEMAWRAMTLEERRAAKEKEAAEREGTGTAPASP